MGVDELAMMDQHEDWGAQMMAQQPPMMMGGGGGDWAAEMMAQRPQCPASWADQFAHQHQQQGGGWVEEFENQQECQTFGVVGEEPISFEAKQANARSNDFIEMNRNKDWAQQFQEAAAPEDWASQFLAQNEGENWANQFQEMAGTEDWAAQFKEMMEGDEWAKEFTGVADPSDYPFEEDNPFMFHENPFEEGLKLKEAGCLPQAALAFEATVRKEPDHHAGWKQLGLTQADNEKDKHAVAALLHARRIVEHDEEVLIQLGVSLTNEGRRDQALETFRDWLAAHPVHGEFSKKAMAIADTSDGFADVARGYAVDYFEKQDKDTKRTIDLYETVLRQAPDPSLHAVLGVLHHMNRDFNRAAYHYQSLLEHPGKDQDSKLWNRLGAIQANGGNHEEALQSYNKALDLNPSFVRTHYNIGIAYSQLNRQDLSAKSFLRALELQSTGPGSGKPDFGAMDIWDSLRRTFSVMGRNDLYELTWKGDLSLFTEFRGDGGF
eukprot:TRINITY_DN46512_c0_g1_i1.p1 TRINITY_DN46512_c0_g1~~TRINITY_DN46512_c0_g1_i1.p1  ORF type:complete len:549 (+),score=150.72 TRINITY_DN46512_c0_g1_i1:171-1649(+)